MIVSQVSRNLAARSMQAAQKNQRRGILDYLTNYPDKVMEQKAIQQKGGTCLGHRNPTWLKQPGDIGVALFGLALTSYGFVSALVGHYRMAHGTGKLD